MQNSAISFMACFNEDAKKAEHLTALLKERFVVGMRLDNTLLTIFNYNETNSEVRQIIGDRATILEQKSSSALQLLLN